MMKTISMWKNVGRFTPLRNRQGRFTPQIVCTIYPPQNWLYLYLLAT